MPPEEGPDDLELFAKIASGDYHAFSVLYDRYIRSLTNYGLRFTDDVETVRDCLHDIFVSIWTRRETLRISSSVKSYLVKSVRTAVCQKVLRNRKTGPVTDDDDGGIPFHFAISPEESLLDSEKSRHLYQRVQELLGKLTPKQKEVIYLRYYHDLSFEEIAGQLDLSVKACYKLMHRAMQELRQSAPDVFLLLLCLVSGS
jgi:RNA polymerase sigma factor (sigma-70 family)